MAPGLGGGGRGPTRLRGALGSELGSTGCAVGRCGRLLKEHFPASPDNSNELSDRVVESSRI